MSDWRPINIFYAADNPSGGQTAAGADAIAAAMMKLREERERGSEQMKRDLELRIQLDTQLGLHADKIQNEIQLSELRRKEQEDMLAILNQQVAIEAAATAGQREITAATTAQTIAQEALNAAKKAYTGDAKKMDKAVEKETAALQRANEILEEKIDLHSGAIENQEKLTEALAVGEKQLIKNIATESKMQISKKKDLAVQNESNEAMGKAVAKSPALAKGLELVGKAGAYARNPMAALNTMFFAMVGNIIEMTMAYDTHRAELAKTTGGTGEFNQELSTAMNTAAQSGLLMAEAAAGMNKLAGSFVNFNMVSAETRVSLGQTVALFENFGVDITENLNTATKGMGFSAKAAEQLQVDLYATGTALGPHMTKKIMSEFGPAMASLAAFTKDRAIKVFKNLAAQSAATGLAISELTGLASKFDTYDSAAESVGRMNSLLGGDYLNSIQMLNATEGERIKMLQNSLKMSGKQFSHMSRFEKKALASSVGITDMTKAMKLFGTSAENLAIMEKKAKDAGLTIDQFKARQVATKDVSKQFQVAMQNLAVAFKPVIDALTWMTKLLAKVLSTPWLKWVILGTAGFVALAVAIRKTTMAMAAMKAGATAIKAMGVGSFLLGKKMPGKGGGLIPKDTSPAPVADKKPPKRRGRFLRDLSKIKAKQILSIAVALLAFGAAIVMIGAGIYIAAKGMALFVKSFDGMSVDKIHAVTYALLVFMGGMVAIVAILAFAAPALAGATIPLLAFGAAILLIGIGIAVAAFGMSILVGAFTSLQDVDLLKIALGMVAVAGAMAVLTLSAWAVAASFAAYIVAGVILLAFSVVLVAVGAASAAAGAGMALLNKTLGSFLNDIGIGKLGTAASSLVKFAGAVGILTVSLAALQLLSIVTAITSFFGLGPSNALAGFIFGVASAIESIEGDTIKKLVGMSKSVGDLKDNLIAMGDIDPKIVTTTTDVFEQIAKITPGNAKAAASAVQALSKAVIDIQKQNKIELELKITHNNIKATDDSLHAFTRKLNKKLNESMA